ncbi:bifunctional 4-alpha-glucanotransferase/amylo-alpha-1,6-glucosidase [Martiniozyma asiatica (nom. inval.)]|nr:bifunctional 4-alpha-glucanotransferase/amylo-alpha-1,6-glucosidase [Martiniozyma asiatica]
MTKIVLLRIGSNGEPVVNNSGVLTFPDSPPDSNASEGAPLFILRAYIQAGSEIANNGKFWTDMCVDCNEGFKRGQFHSTDVKTNFYEDTYIDLPVYKPGSYAYYFTYNKLDENDDEQECQSCNYYFVVPPSLFINGEYVTLNSVTMQSVISKWVGNDLDKDWPALFEHVKNKGYNMIHFTPLQERGESNSPYSIYDQLTYDPAIFKNGTDDVQSMVETLEKDYGILSMTDIVLNHTANNSQWIRDYPDVGYNEETAPHLKAAIELDSNLLHFSSRMSSHGYPCEISNETDLNKIIDGIKIHVLGDLKLWQYYVLNVNEHLTKLEHSWTYADKSKFCKIEVPNEIKYDLIKLAAFVKDTCAVNKFTLGDRFGNQLDIAKFSAVLADLHDPDASFEGIKKHASEIMDEINLPLYREYDTDNSIIMDQIYNRIKYLRLDDNGPKLGKITEENPLTEPYFTRFNDSQGKSWALANNGWIWGGNPLVDFASNKTKDYLLRKVIVWGDCVKLRYGDKYEDSPHLWDRMISYSKLLAKSFHGVRIDNCHSTPLHVGEAMLDAAREVNPNLYVVAELFSGSEDLDILYVQRLGLSSLIREAMQAHSVAELSRLCHRHGGRPIGSFKWLPLDTISYPAHQDDFRLKEAEDIIKKSEIPLPQFVVSQQPHALFMDCTHDNETPAQKRTVEDTLPTAALVAFCSCATGTTFGFDEGYPKLLDVVQEKRHYSYNENMGISEVKGKLNDIRHFLASQSTDDSGSNEMFVHHEGEFITILRNNAKSGKGYFLIARTKFWQDSDQSLAPIRLSGTKVKFEFSYSLKKIGDAENNNDGFIHPIKTELETLKSLKCEYHIDGDFTEVTLPEYFPQGSIAVLSTEIPGCDETLDDFVRTGAIAATEDLTLVDINNILYRSESEEYDASGGKSGVYSVPNHGPLVFAGIQGWISVLKNIITNNDLSHPLTTHLREGKWALDYTFNRLSYYIDEDNRICQFADWLESRLDRIKSAPYFLIPRYFALVVGIAYEALRFRALRLMSEEIQKSTAFIQSLAMVSVQMIGKMKNASIHPNKIIPSMAAGLPHFSNDFMRCWGRDVFISGRGLTLATERYDSAKDHIFCFAKTLKHGLIPNLLGSGKDPRYNARDAAWFYLQFIQDYILLAPNGEDILKEKVKRRFPLDDTWIPVDDPLAFSYESSIEEVIYEILKRHAASINYREANAGPRIDSQMKDEGFNVSVYVDWETGLIHGGNQWNCGTWMDKMGESLRAGNKGYPGTPRDGAAVEINGLLKSTLRFVIELYERGLFKWDSVVNQNGDTITFKQWDQLVQDNFERCFYVPEDESEDDQYVIDKKLVNRRGIYKDLFKTSSPYEDYQLRGNFPIAMVVAPELFTDSKALKAIDTADKVLRGPIGLRTLDPIDFNYRPYYVNGIDNDDFMTSKGRNYHQGPEWVWIMGYFLRAYASIHIDADKRCHSRKGCNDYIYQMIWKRLEKHKEWIEESVWSGLTELTNKDGELCGDSSPTQAWSASCLLDVLLDMKTRDSSLAS